MQYITFFYGLQTIHLLLYLIANIIFCPKKKYTFGVNVADSWLNEVSLVINYKIGCLLFLYMGLSIGGDSWKMNLLFHLIDRIKSRLSGWKSCNLSSSDLLILLKSDLSSFPSSKLLRVLSHLRAIFTTISCILVVQVAFRLNWPWILFSFLLCA